MKTQLLSNTHKNAQGIFGVLLLAIVLMLSVTSCTKDPETGRGGKGDSPICGECLHTGTVVFLPAQCAPDVTDELGILNGDGKYMSVCEDPTGKFSSLKEGDKITFNYEITECFVCTACTCPNPDMFVKLSCLNTEQKLRH